MADRSIRVRLLADIQSYMQGLNRAAGATAAFGREVSGFGNTAKADIEAVGRSTLLMSTGITVGLGLAAKAAIDWESAWAGVSKTVNGSAEELAALEDGLRQMATELPATHGEIAAVAEAAGALGVATPAIEGFTRVMIDLGETTDLTAEQAADSFARIANIMGTAQNDFDRMGSTLVDLGNNGASTESEILELANRLAAAGEIAGLSEADVFAFSSTLASVGVEAEAGGTALSKVFTSIRDAVIDGGAKLETFARVAGVTAQDFVAAFRDDPAAAIESFISGLGRVNDAGQSTTGIFSDLELTDQRLMRALLSTAGAGDLLTEQLDLAAAAWEANNALQTEAEKRYETTAAQLGMVRNQLVDLGIDIGEKMLPFIRGAIDGVSQLALGLGDMPGPAQTAVVALAGITAAGTGVIGVLAVVGPKVKAAHDALMAMGTAGQFVGRNLSKMGLIAGGVFAAIGAVAYVMGENAKKAREAQQRVDDYTASIREAGDVAAGVADQMSTFLAANVDVAEGLADTGTSVEALQDALLGSEAEWDAFIRHFVAVAEAAGLSQGEIAATVLPLGQQRDAALDGAEAAGTLNEVLGETPGVAGPAADALGETVTPAEEAAEAYDTARDALQNYVDTVRGVTDPVFALVNAQRRNVGAQDAVNRAVQARADAEAELQRVTGDPEATEADRRRAREALWDATIAISDAQLTAVESAGDLETAQLNLVGQIQLGTTSVGDAQAALARWAAQGMITTEQAMLLGAELANVAAQAEDLHGEEITMVLGISTDPALAALDRFYAKVAEYAAKGQMFLTTVPGLKQAAGGFVPGVGNSDSVPSMLTPGEFVIKKSAAQALGASTLHALNSGVRPSAMFYDGGMVTSGSASGWSGGGSTVTVTQQITQQVQGYPDAWTAAVWRQEGRKGAAEFAAGRSLELAGG